MSYDENLWHAVISDEDGFVLSEANFDEWVKEELDDGRHLDSEPESFSIVTGSAIPKPQSSRPDEEFFRLPGSYLAIDVLFEVDLLSRELAEIRTTVARGRAVAAALNKAGVK